MSVLLPWTCLNPSACPGCPSPLLSHLPGRSLSSGRPSPPAHPYSGPAPCLSLCSTHHGFWFQILICYCRFPVFPIFLTVFPRWNCKILWAKATPVFVLESTDLARPHSWRGVSSSLRDLLSSQKWNLHLSEGTHAWSFHLEKKFLPWAFCCSLSTPCYCWSVDLWRSISHWW